MAARVKERQLDLFDSARRRRRSPEAMDQDQQIERVASRIGDFVLEFLRERWRVGSRQFFIRELLIFVAQRSATAPASPDRILRQLRASGRADYRVLDRAKSFYEITRVT